MHDKFFVFDVESVGLLGSPISVGWVVVTRDGVELESGLLNCYNSENGGVRIYLHGDAGSQEWVRDNIPAMDLTHKEIESMTHAFCGVYLRWYGKATFAAECPFPVEARFLLKMLKHVVLEPPYPLLDVTSIMFAAGMDPMKKYDRLKSELPKHNPLADARQSARLMLEALDKLAEISYFATSKGYG